MGTTTTIALTLTVVLSLLLPIHGALEVRHLPRTYTLHSGRTSACPNNVRYGSAIATTMTIPSGSIQADNKKCVGPGGKVIRSGSVLRNSGVPLPSILSGSAIRFFAGVESATRVCGGHAFNATAVSYFITTTQRVVDAPTGLTIEPGNLYAIYAHFAHLCVYRASLSAAESNQIKMPSIRGSVHADGGPATSRDTEIPVRQPRTVCFPSHAIAHTRTHAVRMSDLQVGDEVAVAPGVYSKIYTFSHRDSTAQAYFVRVTTSSNTTLELTPGHLLYANNLQSPIPASKLSLGDTLYFVDGTSSTVRSIRSVISTGLYAPHTIHGDIVVNSIIASCYTDYVKPLAAHALLTPLRALYLPVHLTDRIFDSFRSFLSTSF